MATNGIPSIEENSIEKNSIDKIIKIYEEEIGFLTPFQLQFLEDYKHNFSDDMIIEAIRRASKANKKSLAYVEGILRNWIKNGYKTLADIKDDVKLKKKDDLDKTKEDLGISSFDDLYEN